jgi:hypothetical protein
MSNGWRRVVTAGDVLGAIQILGQAQVRPPAQRLHFDTSHQAYADVDDNDIVSFWEGDDWLRIEKVLTLSE